MLPLFIFYINTVLRKFTEDKFGNLTWAQYILEIASFIILFILYFFLLSRIGMYLYREGLMKTMPNIFSPIYNMNQLFTMLLAIALFF